MCVEAQVTDSGSRKTFLRDIARPENIRACLLWACLPALLFYVISFTLLKIGGFTTVEILRDVMQQTGQHSLLGFLSSVGAWLWVAAATLCFFRYALERREGSGRYRKLLILTGGFSLFLGVDLWPVEQAVARQRQRGRVNALHPPGASNCGRYPRAWRRPRAVPCLPPRRTRAWACGTRCIR